MTLSILGLLGLICFGCAPASGGADEGQMLPTFSVESVQSQGQPFKTVDLKGKVALIDFWATWCGPCREAMPGIERLYEKYKSKGLEVAGISDEPANTVRPFLESAGISYPIYLDTERKANEALGIVSLPTILVVGKDGTILKKIVGYGPEVDSELEAAVQTALSR